MTTYREFCLLRDQRRAGEEAPQHTEEAAFDLAILNSIGIKHMAQVTNLRSLLTTQAAQIEDQDKSAYLLKLQNAGLVTAMRRMALRASGDTEAQAIASEALEAPRQDAGPAASAMYWTVTLSGYQLREALDFINPDGPGALDQLEDELTFGIRNHADDDGKVSTGMCCWNDDTDGVLPLDGEFAESADTSDQTEIDGQMITALRSCGFFVRTSGLLDNQRPQVLGHLDNVFSLIKLKGGA